MLNNKKIYVIKKISYVYTLAYLHKHRNMVRFDLVRKSVKFNKLYDKEVEFMGEYITISEALVLSLISIVSVFLILILISFMISVLKLLGDDKKEEENVFQNNNKITDEEVVAISSAIAMVLDKSPGEFTIKNIKKE